MSIQPSDNDWNSSKTYNRILRTDSIYRISTKIQRIKAYFHLKNYAEKILTILLKLNAWISNCKFSLIHVFFFNASGSFWISIAVWYLIVNRGCKWFGCVPWKFLFQLNYLLVFSFVIFVSNKNRKLFKSLKLKV